jgi:FkbM family methyltransferase
MYRIIVRVSRGLVGIASSKNFSIVKKLRIYVDYFKLIFLVAESKVSFRLTNPSVDKKFFISSFDFKVYYSNIYTLFFMFNEIFCDSEYPAFFNLETYVDLGANIGIPIFWYHFFNPKMRTYAFEPDEINFRLLEKNIKENHIENCFLFKKAVSNVNGKIKFYRILDNIQSLDSGLKLNQKLPHEVLQVESKKLSSLMRKIKHISLMKMDIEGGEYAVFEDLKKTNSLSQIEKIIFESHIFTSTEKKDLAKTLAWIEQSGKIWSHKTSKYTSIHLWKNDRSCSIV